MKRVRVDPDLFVGHGLCYELALDVFEEDEDRGHCRVRLARVEGDLEKAAGRASDNCPEGAIFVEADD